MALNGKLLPPLLVLGVLIVLILVASVASKPNSTCERTCGTVEIPYPFGASEGCSLGKPFLITCDNAAHPRPKPSLGPDMFVENISVLHGELRVLNPIASLCKVLEHKKLGQKPDPLRSDKRAIPCGKQTAYRSCTSGSGQSARPDAPAFSISVNYSGNSALFKLSNFRISNKRNKITAVGCGVYPLFKALWNRRASLLGVYNFGKAKDSPHHKDLG